MLSVSADHRPSRPIGLFLLVFMAGCSSPPSVLDPAGEEASQIAALFWVMLSGAVLIWVFVAAALVYALRPNRQVHDERASGRLIFWGGAVFPSVTLFLLLGYALWVMPGLRPFARTSDANLRIEVTGRQFWWEVIYFPQNGAPVSSANEIRLPVGERVELLLKSGDVIHSFWIPALGGKMDMIPGRTNRLSLLATKPGAFRGPCAEYCGTSHALMAFVAVAMPAEEFQHWLAAQAHPSSGAGNVGAALFRDHGCGACHRVAGTEASGLIGPDLSHVGSRQTIGAGLLINTEEEMRRFIASPHIIKPGQHMPAFNMLAEEDLRAIAAYLTALK